MGLTGSYHKRYINDLRKHLLDMLSRDPSTLGAEEEKSFAILLTEICCGRLPELENTWQQGRALPADTPFSPDLLIDEILSLIMPRDRAPSMCIVCQVLNAVFRTGDIGAGNEILSLLFRRSPSLSKYIARKFSWDSVHPFPPPHFLGISSDSTLEILEGCGADLNCLRYYAMASVSEIPYWSKVLRKGVGDAVINLLLLFSAMNGSAKLVQYLVAKGAIVNFHCGSTGPYPSGWTALAYSAQMGNTEAAVFLLSNGADILQGPVDSKGRQYAVSQLARSSNPDLAKFLVQIECEEAAKRDKSHGMSSSSCPVHALIGYRATSD